MGLAGAGMVIFCLSNRWQAEIGIDKAFSFYGFPLYQI
jgi:hypothetical protein